MEIRRHHADPEHDLREVDQRTGRSILHGISDEELEPLADELRRRLPEGALIERDRLDRLAGRTLGLILGRRPVAGEPARFPCGPERTRLVGSAGALPGEGAAMTARRGEPPARPSDPGRDTIQDVGPVPRDTRRLQPSVSARHRVAPARRASP